MITIDVIATLQAILAILAGGYTLFCIASTTRRLIVRPKKAAPKSQEQEAADSLTRLWELMDIYGDATWTELNQFIGLYLAAQATTKYFRWTLDLIFDTASSANEKRWIEATRTLYDKRDGFVRWSEVLWRAGIGPQTNGVYYDDTVENYLSNHRKKVSEQERRNK